MSWWSLVIHPGGKYRSRITYLTDPKSPETLGRDCSYSLALNFKENRKALKPIASLETSLIFDISKASRKVLRWVLGCSSGNLEWTQFLNLFDECRLELKRTYRYRRSHDTRYWSIQSGSSIVYQSPRLTFLFPHIHWFRTLKLLCKLSHSTMQCSLNFGILLNRSCCAISGHPQFPKNKNSKSNINNKLQNIKHNVMKRKLLKIKENKRNK